jgi:hypothetical protein
MIPNLILTWPAGAAHRGASALSSARGALRLAIRLAQRARADGVRRCNAGCREAGDRDDHREDGEGGGA